VCSPGRCAAPIVVCGESLPPTHHVARLHGAEIHGMHSQLPEEASAWLGAGAWR